MAHPAAWDGRTPCHEFRRQRLVWVEVPKAASTTIKVALANALFGADYPDDVGLHEAVGYTYAAGPEQLHEWLTGRWAGWHRFTVVRHPMARFASLYREKIDPGGFGDIDAWVAANADSFWWDDIHAVPQTRIIGDPAAYDHVGRVERLDEAAELLSWWAGAPVTFARHNATSPGAPFAEATRALLARRYADDLRALGYDAEAGT